MEDLSEKWGDLLRLALSLKIPPDIFWKMTPQELILVYKSQNLQKNSEISSTELKELMEKFPD